MRGIKEIINDYFDGCNCSSCEQARENAYVTIKKKIGQVLDLVKLDKKNDHLAEYGGNCDCTFCKEERIWNEVVDELEALKEKIRKDL